MPTRGRGFLARLTQLGLDRTGALLDFSLACSVALQLFQLRAQPMYRILLLGDQDLPVGDRALGIGDPSQARGIAILQRDHLLVELDQTTAVARGCFESRGCCDFGFGALLMQSIELVLQYPLLAPCLAIAPGENLDRLLKTLERRTHIGRFVGSHSLYHFDLCNHDAR